MTRFNTKCAAVIPCLNEAATIAAVVNAVRRHVTTVIVVDDGSTDGTAALAQSAGADVWSHGVCRGKGTALQTGWRMARERGFRLALSLDGDGQHAAEDIPAFRECAERTGASLVIGNRMANPQGMPWLRRWVNRWMSARISRATGRNLPDSQCGFRLMDLNVWSSLRTAAAHFEIESEILCAFAVAGQRIEFVPVQVIYKHERSKIHPLRDTWRWFRWWRRIHAVRKSAASGREIAALPSLSLVKRNPPGVG